MARTPFRDRPIKQKLRIVTLIIIIIMGLIAISGDVAKEYLALHSEARNKMAALSSIIAQASVAGITFNDAKESEKELALLMTVQNITSATIYLADGAEFAGYKRKNTDEKEFAGYFYRDLHSLSQPIVLDGRALGRIEVKWELQEEYKKLLLYLFMVVTLTFIFAPLISLFLIERLMQTIIRPIAVLSGSAAEIGKGNLSHRVEVTSKDEIGQLAASFNRMTEDLQETTVSMELLIREVEERQRVEEVLKNKDAEWQNTFDSISDFVSIHTLDFKFMRINKALADFLGVTPEETIGRPCYELYHGLNEPLNACPVHAMLESRQPETREVSEPGRGLFLLVTTSPVFDRNGEMIASVHIAKDITERKKMEAALQASEARFRHLSEATFEGVAISESGLILDANNSFLDMLGYEKIEEVVGKNALEFTAPESRELVAKHIAQGYEKPYEAAALRKDGSVMLVEIRGRMMEIPGGRRIRFTAIRDITERKRAEEALRTAELRYRSIFEQAADAIWLIDAQTGAFVEFNTRAYESLGYTREEFGQLRITDIELVETADEVALHIRKVLEEGSDVFETKHRTRNGETRDILVSASMLTIGGRKYLQSIMRDITERKQAEEALAESESRFREIFNTISDAIFIHDAETGRILDVNRRMCEMYGFTREEALACGPDDLSAGTPPYSSAEAIEKIHLAHLVGPQTFDWLARARDGHLFWVEVTLRFALIGSQPRILAVVRDITERRKFMEELKRSNTDLEQFSYAISHDMRQPLRMISSYLQLLETVFAGQLDSEKREWFNFAIDGAKRLDQMLLSLLEYSRVGRKGAPLAWVESRDLLHEALLFLKADLAKADAGLRITGDWPRIFVSRDELVRLLQNLIGNALKFRVAGRTPEINIYSETVEKEWHLSVSDNGVGIAPEQLGRLFQVFQRLQLRTAYEGTGVGLALCRKIVEHHRGLIWAESAGEGKGSTFKVILPIDNAGGGGGDI